MRTSVLFLTVKSVLPLEIWEGRSSIPQVVIGSTEHNWKHIIYLGGESNSSWKQKPALNVGWCGGLFCLPDYISRELERLAPNVSSSIYLMEPQMPSFCMLPIIPCVCGRVLSNMHILLGGPIQFCI